MPDDHGPSNATARRLLPVMADRLIVALDLPTIAAAHDLVARLDGIVSFFKIGPWLQYEPGFDGLIDGLVGAGKRIFLDAKLFDIPETVGNAVAAAARRKVSFITVHGDAMIMQAAMRGKGASDIKVFAVTVLTSLDDAALQATGYALGARDLVRMRAKLAVACGCDGIIASANDDPEGIRLLADHPGLLITTPGVRQATGDIQDHRRTATPTEAIRNGADYLVVGRPIVAAADPVAAARSFIAEMEAA